jgi:HSP20 family protein
MNRHSKDLFDLVDYFFDHATVMKQPEDLKTVPICTRKLRKDGEYVLEFLLPGAESENVRLTVHKRTLTVSHDPGESENDGSEVFTEFQVGKTERSIVLPDDVEADVDSAKLSQGILRVILKVKDEEKARDIPIG